MRAAAWIGAATRLDLPLGFRDLAIDIRVQPVFVHLLHRRKAGVPAAEPSGDSTSATAPRARQARHDSANGHLEHGSGLCITHLLDPDQRQHFAMFIGEPSKRSPDFGECQLRLGRVRSGLRLARINTEALIVQRLDRTPRARRSQKRCA
jgi:hypothetical protein